MEDLKQEIWSLLISNQKMRESEIYQLLQEEGADKSKVKEAINSLMEKALIQYNPEKGSEDPFIKKRQILGAILTELPCLGCQSIGKCDIGGVYSPENCERLSLWTKSL